ncbi:diguanylate cyclase [Gallaecimonas sp. GXIMD4217]|uniref:GGDEF domain-containing protein n=1 Tax=Gallaecimonas sp. GXIMD4217 TaxID=3131927 RepID=UPI00311B0632
MSDPIDLEGKLRERLAATLKQTELLKQRQDQSHQMLLALLKHLDHACRGIDQELDDSLQRLRQLLASPQVLTERHAQLQQLSGRLAGLEDRGEQAYQQCHRLISDALRQLQRNNHLPGDLRREVRSLLMDMDMPRLSLYRLLPLLKETLSLQLRLLSLRQRNTGAVGSFSSDDNRSTVDKLMELISRLNLGGADHELQDIRRRLLAPLDQHELQALSLDFLDSLVKIIEAERSASREFLSNLTQALGKVHDKSLKVLASHQADGKAQDRLNQALSDKLGALMAALESGGDTRQLQQDMSRHLGEFAELFTEKTALEASQRQALDDQLERLHNKISQLETESQAYINKLSQQRTLSLRDSLTQIPNRAAFEERLSIEYKRYQRFGHALWIAIIDIDHFKRINDTFGHTAGDKTLRVVANAIRRTLRDTDFVARFGGEEFVLLLPETRDDVVLRPLEKLQEAIRSIPFKFRDQDVRITISIGAAKLQGAERPMECFERADQALYEAKHAGRDKVVVAR